MQLNKYTHTHTQSFTLRSHGDSRRVRKLHGLDGGFRLSYNMRFPSEHGTISADKGSASLHQTVLIGPGPRNGIGEQRLATLTYNSRPRVSDQKIVEIGVLTPMARIDVRMGTELRAGR